MATTYKILGQILPTANTLSNVYVVPTSTSTIVNTITICNQDTANANVDIILRPVNETLAAKHYLLRGVTIPRADTLIISPGLTLNASVILAVNNAVAAGEVAANISFNAFGVELS
jgi:hypothetical protein